LVEYFKLILQRLKLQFFYCMYLKHYDLLINIHVFINKVFLCKSMIDIKEDRIELWVENFCNFCKVIYDRVIIDTIDRIFNVAVYENYL